MISRTLDSLATNCIQGSRVSRTRPIFRFALPLRAVSTKRICQVHRFSVVFSRFSVAVRQCALRAVVITLTKLNLPALSELSITRVILGTSFLHPARFSLSPRLPRVAGSLKSGINCALLQRVQARDLLGLKIFSRWKRKCCHVRVTYTILGTSDRYDWNYCCF